MRRHVLGRILGQGGPGAIVMAVGGAFLLIAAGVAPLSRRPLPRGLGLRLALAAALFVAR